MLAMLLVLSFPLKAKTSHADFIPWLTMVKAAAPKKELNFAGLAFSMPESLGSCAPKDKKLVCALKAANGPCELIFEEANLNGAQSLPLLRLLRKQAWQAIYGRVSSYTEALYETGLGKLVQQRGVIYRLDNIQWPVLLRAFDVVISHKTCISISTKCSRYDWPLLEKEIDQILSSLKMSAKD